jgi:hypothetical protein
VLATGRERYVRILILVASDPEDAAVTEMTIPRQFHDR